MQKKSGQAIVTKSGPSRIDSGIPWAGPSRDKPYSESSVSRTGVGEWILIAASSFISFLVVGTRFTGVRVSVLKDEYIYLLDSHYKDVSEFRLPNELFQFVYGATKLCGENFYDCARGINAAFVVGGALFIYFLVRMVAKDNRWLGALAALATIFGTNGTYAAYFMPEAIFNFLMIGFFYLLLKYGQAQDWRTWVGMGAVFALATLAKPHAFFVLPAVLIYVALAARWAEGRYVVAVLRRTALLVGSVFSSNMFVSWLSQRDQPTNVFGTYMGSTTTPVAIVEGSGLQILTALPGTALGQILVIVLTIGLALPVAVIAVFSMLRKADNVSFNESKTGILFVFALASMMAVTAVFESWIELFTWMHTRYYAYLIPLALVVLAEAWAKSRMGKVSRLNSAMIGIFTVTSVYAFITAARPYNTNWVDAPDFKFHVDNPSISGLLVGATLVAGVVYLFDSRTSLLLGFLILSAAYLGAGQYITNYLFENFGKDTVSDDLARILRTALTEEQVDRTVLVGPDVVGMDRALFGSRSGSARAHVMSGESSDLSFIKPNDLWVVSFGDVRLEGLGSATINGYGFSLYSLADDGDITSRFAVQNAITSTCVSPENIGWSCESETAIVWEGEAQRGSVLDIIFEVHGENQEVAFTFGSNKIGGTYGEGIWVQTLRFSGVGELLPLSIVSTVPQYSKSKTEEKVVRLLHIGFKQ